MTSVGVEEIAAVLWMDDEPERLQRDRREVEAFSSDLTFYGPCPTLPHGGWLGRLPLWPFDRPQPDGLSELLDAGVKVEVAFSAAHPMVPPSILPLIPEPAIFERTQQIWHVAPDGSLCLLQNQGQWQPEASITELLLKAAGWHVEYALMQAEVIDRMTECGIVDDDSLDLLVAQAAQRLADSGGHTSLHAAPGQHGDTC